jgi:hypothetical protein
MAEAQNAEQLVAIYVKLRDGKKAEAKAFKERVEKIDQAMSKLEAKLLVQLDAVGGEGIRTKSGTAYKTTKTSATVADWDSLLKFIIADNAYHMLEHRVSKEAVVEYKEEHKDVPPGVSWREEITVGVRRS